MLLRKLIHVYELGGVVIDFRNTTFEEIRKVVNPWESDFGYYYTKLVHPGMNGLYCDNALHLEQADFSRSFEKNRQNILKKFLEYSVRQGYYSEVLGGKGNTVSGYPDIFIYNPNGIRNNFAGQRIFIRNGLSLTDLQADDILSQSAERIDALTSKQTELIQKKMDYMPLVLHLCIMDAYPMILGGVSFSDLLMTPDVFSPVGVVAKLIFGLFFLSFGLANLIVDVPEWLLSIRLNNWYARLMAAEQK